MIKHTITQEDIDNKEQFTNLASEAGQVVDIEPNIRAGYIPKEDIKEILEEDVDNLDINGTLG